MSNSIRLNDHYRRRIRDKIIGDRFKTRREKLDINRTQLAVDIYLAELGAEVDGLCATPAHWVPRLDAIEVQFGDNYDELSFPVPVEAEPTVSETKRRRRGPRKHGGSHKRGKPAPDNTNLPDYPVPYSKLDGAFAAYGVRHAFTKRWNAIERERQTIEAEEKTLTEEVWTVVNSVTTAKRLKAIWPEVAAIVDEVVSAVMPTNLPAVPLTKLNKKLGLPPAEAA